jgi:hypothetical protein
MAKRRNFLPWVRVLPNKRRHWDGQEQAACTALGFHSTLVSPWWHLSGAACRNRHRGDGEACVCPVPKRETNVHHLTDPELQENQNVAVRYGAWDTVENGEARRVSENTAGEELHKQRAKEEKKREESEERLNPKERILILAERGYSPDQIADTIRGGYTEETVAAILRDSSMQKAW